jgi:uncharacterized membrane protein YphA (DoxX/SURF4 family)
VSGILANSSALIALAIPNIVIWSYSVFAVILAIGLLSIFLHCDWQKARGIDKLLLFGPPIYAAPVAGFGTEHFTLPAVIASIIPSWIPGHPFWVYFVGACLIAGALSLVTGIQARLAATLLGVTFFLFVALMHGPAAIRNPQNRIVMVVAFRELSFSGGAFALAAALTSQSLEQSKRFLAAIARYLVAVPVLLFSVEQFLHGDRVPGVPLDPITPAYVPGHAIWTYLAAVVYAVAGILLLLGKKTRAAATSLGATVLLIVLVVYVPIAVVERASLAKGFNYLADTMMFCGAVLLLAGAMPRES